MSRLPSDCAVFVNHDADDPCEWYTVMQGTREAMYTGAASIIAQGETCEEAVAAALLVLAAERGGQ